MPTTPDSYAESSCGARGASWTSSMSTTRLREVENTHESAAMMHSTTREATSAYQSYKGARRAMFDARLSKKSIRGRAARTSVQRLPQILSQTLHEELLQRRRRSLAHHLRQHPLVAVPQGTLAANVAVFLLFLQPER